MIARTRSRELQGLRRQLQSLILDLPDFEGPLATIRGHHASGQVVRLYRRLGLDRFRSEIDERVEVVESIFDSLAESLDHSQSLAFQIALELFIVAVLLLDVGLYFVDAHWKCGKGEAAAEPPKRHSSTGEGEAPAEPPSANHGPYRSQNTNATGPAKISESTTSRMPPNPGTASDASFRSQSRLIIDSIKSPTWATTPINSP